MSAEKLSLKDPSLYLNREMDWLEFNWRVLHEAQDTRNPVLERLKFLAITDNNLDEFVMKRVGGLKRQVLAHVSTPSIDGRTPGEQLAMILANIGDMIRIIDMTLVNEIIPALARIGLRIANYTDLTVDQRDRVDRYYLESVHPILTLLCVDAGHPFPLISNLSMSLGARIGRAGRDEDLFVRIKIPTNRPRWVQVDQEDEFVFVPLEQLVAHNLHRFYPNDTILEVVPFRVTRNADIERNEEEAEDLLALIKEELRSRQRADAVRLELPPQASDEMVRQLCEELQLEPGDVYHRQGFLTIRDFMTLTSLDCPQALYEPWEPARHPRLPQHTRMRDTGERLSMFDIIREGDLLVHHPYQSFHGSVLRLLEEAADDPHVLAIKQTLYRTAPRSPIISALLRASEKGKQVVVLVEIKARFDEAKNIEWVQVLEEAGVHVCYGFAGLKTHTKTLLVLREEPEGIRHYFHIGTGNYHTVTARVYTDLGLLSCDPEIGADLTDMFNFLTGHCQTMEYRKLLVAPFNMRQRFLEMIEREIECHQRSNNGRIVAKMNQLEDADIIRALYRASQAGVAIDLVVRGFCCLRPGVPGVSENIRIISIIGRFLEHSRIYYFHNGGQEEFYIGSADWMSRNLDNRVEAITPVESKELCGQLRSILEVCLSDNRLAWELQPDGHYLQRVPPETGRESNSQKYFARKATKAGRGGKGS